MQMPQINQVNQPNYYGASPHGGPQSKKKAVLVGAGILVLLIMIFVVVFSGRSKPGQEDMRAALESTSDALAITDAYSNDLQSSSTKNDVALTQILVRGNFQKLNELYNETYKPRKKLPASTKIDSESAEILDRAKRNNTLDSEIITVLDERVTQAQTELTKARGAYKKASAREIVNTSISDFESVSELLNKAR